MKKFNDYLKEMAGTFAIVGCKENPNYQVWGARSDLKCSKHKKQKILKMKFKDWTELKEQEQKIDLKDFLKRFKIKPKTQQATNQQQQQDLNRQDKNQGQNKWTPPIKPI